MVSGIHSRAAALVLAAMTAAAATLVACSPDSALPTGPRAPAPRAVDLPPVCHPDVTAPVITSVSASPNVLWPPNHKMVAVSVSVAASDACSGVTNQIVSVTSNEPVNGVGDGDTAPDWIVTGHLSLLLRSERAGPGSGRVYTIIVRSADAAGNSTTASTTVSVPHDQGGRR